MKTFDQAIKKVLVTEEEIQAKVKELGEIITDYYRGKEDDLLIVGILRGSVIFLSDLVRQIDFPVQLDFMAVSSYGSSSETSGVVRIIKDLEEDIKDKNILIVEDIVDSGLTLQYLKNNMKERGAKEVKTVSLLNKPERRVAPIHVDFIGYDIPDEFVVGYGLDFDQFGRNLPYVAALKEEVYQ